MNSDISYIMSCSQDEFEATTGVQLPENAFDLWSNDMDKRQKELMTLFAEAIAKEREAAEERVVDLFTDMETPYLPDIIKAIRAKGEA